MPKKPASENLTHPTKALLLDTVEQMLDTVGYEHVAIDAVLEASGVSRGSLYHHFEDFPDLIEQALVRRFARGVDKSIELIAEIVATSTTQEELRAGLRNVTRISQADELRENRFKRAQLLGLAGDNPRLREALAQEQGRLTEALADLFRETMERGWMSSDFDPKAGAILIQGYTLGVIFTDLDPNPITAEQWTGLIDLILDRALLHEYSGAAGGGVDGA